jgi:secreted Zn-dependent insulinase-like peptidase
MSNQVEILTTPIKSPADKKDYRLIKLSNGLKVLLVSSSSFRSNKPAGVSLQISVGGFHDHVFGIFGLAQ